MRHDLSSFVDVSGMTVAQCQRCEAWVRGVPGMGMLAEFVESECDRAARGIPEDAE